MFERIDDKEACTLEATADSFTESKSRFKSGSSKVMGTSGISCEGRAKITGAFSRGNTEAGTTGGTTGGVKAFSFSPTGDFEVIGFFVVSTIG